MQEMGAPTPTALGFLLLLIVHCNSLSAFQWQANEAVSQQNYHKGMRQGCKASEIETSAFGAEHPYEPLQ